MTTTNTKISKYSIIATILLLVILCISLSIIIAKNKRLAEINQLYITAQDSVKTYRNKLGQEVTKTSVLITTNNKYFTDLQTKDVEIKHLQDVVIKESKGRRDVEAAMVLANQTIIKLKDKLTNQIIGDTTINDTIYPTYYKEIKTLWTNGNITMGKYCFDLNLTEKNEYEFVYGTEPYGKWPKKWFVKKEFAQITNLNPNTETTTMKVYHQKSVTKKTLTRFGEGTVVGAAIVIALHSFLK